MRLLIVGPMEGHFATAGRLALAKGAKVAHAADPDQALLFLRNGQGADIMLFDIRFSVRAMMENLARERFHLALIACGIDVRAEDAAEAIHAGAKEYLPLPPDAELIAAILASIAEEGTALLYEDPLMAEVVAMAKHIAPSDANVLITGESGTGKEVMAHFIHAHSKRAQRQFVSINCAAIPENLLESELFGHEKGAFTGAVARRIGKFEEASGGTLLLDEISEMHPRLQAKLLRAIQEREIDRVGGAQKVPVNLRLIATSNRDLIQETRKGTFREDLYFRLNVLNVEIPPLRKRPKDIKLLARHFVKKFAADNGVAVAGISPAGIDSLCQREWRGNVRELENILHRAVLLAMGPMIEPGDLRLPPAAEQSSPSPALVGRSMAEVERTLIIDTLSHCLGNRTHAANILGISIRTLRNKLRQYADEGWSLQNDDGHERSLSL
ncbi:MAG TPA: sigma-54 dependent transcriptional regulator [Dongiaceae bacterium]|jgi:DNA-binding NtrC family response regulator|nr:sigma-54 dependent transcriptional regulator [Dongiaceae bacterium]